MVTSPPNIQIINLSSQLKLALLDLQEFATFCGSDSKRETEKRAALHTVRRVLENSAAEILYEKNGRPHIANSAVKISISHASDKLALLFSYNGKEVGVDIEMVRDKVLKIKEKFLSKAELKELENASVEIYTLYWAIKEAVYKAAGISGLIFAEQIAVTPFRYDKAGGIIEALVKQDKKYILHYRKIDEYILVYTDNA